MANPKIGYNYRLDIPSSLYEETIAWVNNRSRKLYKIWGEIEGKIVNAKAETRAVTPYYIVAMHEHPKDTFYIPKKMLIELTRRLPIPCKCDLKFLLIKGCNCGAFKQEQSEKTK